MIYQSTRSSEGAAPSAAVLQGLARDGGLFLYPQVSELNFDWKSCLKLNTLEMAERILGTLLPDYPEMKALVKKAYAGKFETDDLTPVVKVGDTYVLELFRGPTSAFKDVALSMLPQLITAGRELNGIKDEIVILTATSGDTGKAALEGFHDVPGTRIIVFYPDGGVSPIQRAQMATQEGSNVSVCAVRGNFDDCQRGVKEIFSHVAATGITEGSGVRLSSANSINIGRLCPQIVYYFVAYARLLEAGAVSLGMPVDFVVPTGNFGDILAGYLAKELGLPVGKLICASNSNNVLTDFILTGVYDRRRPFFRTTSPSMDILVSSNLERLLYLVSDNKPELVSEYMDRLQKSGVYELAPDALARVQKDFAAYCADEEQTAVQIKKVWSEFGYLCDPHTAVAFHAAEAFRAEGHENPLVVLSTASPYKFPEAVLKAIEGDANGDEFEMIAHLEKISAVPAPINLTSLQEKPVLHEEVIQAADMMAYVFNKLGIKE